MNNKILSGVFIALFIAIGAACTQQELKPAIDKNKVMQEIQEIENKFAEAFNTRNASAITYYANDAVSYFAGQQPIQGVDAILKHISEEMADLPEGATISFKTLEIYVTDDGDNVAEIGAHTLRDASGAVMQEGHYFSFFAKRDGRYVCTRDMANSVGVMQPDSL